MASHVTGVVLMNGSTYHSASSSKADMSHSGDPTVGPHDVADCGMDLKHAVHIVG